LRLESFFTTGEQMQLFLISCLFGIPIGIFYDIFRVIRIIFPHNSISTAAEDILFFIFYSVFIMSFTFSAARSEFRMYYIFGNAAGFTLYYFSIGKLTSGFFIRITLIIKKYIKKLRLNKR
jgi:spore cortex biosynthesis protein YabQ